MIWLILNICLAVVPSLILLIYFYNKDKQKKEPVSMILKVFSLGFLSVLPAIIIEMLILQFVPERFSVINIIIKSFIVAGLVEESIKLKTVLLVAYPDKNFEKLSDGIIYTITASLGFALFENIFYSFGPASTLILRGVTAVPLHAIASGIMGYYIGKSKFGDTNLKYKGLLIAVLVHGLYDFFLFYGSWFPVLTIPLLVISGSALSKLYKSALKEDRCSRRS